MKTTETGWYQVVIDPKEPDFQRLLAAAMTAADNDPVEIRVTPWLWFKDYFSRLVHPLVHHYVPMKRWDQGSQRIINTGYVTCLWCPRTKEA